MFSVKLISSLILISVVQLGNVYAANKIYFCNYPLSFPQELHIPSHFAKNDAPLQFRSGIRDINCTSSETIHKIANSSEPSFKFLPSGDILVPSEDFLLRKEYCIARFEEDLVEVKHCEVKCGITHVCIHKCCNPEEIVDYSKNWLAEGFCTKSNISWSPIFYDDHKGCGVRTASQVKFHLLPVPEEDVDSVFQPYHHISHTDPISNKTVDPEGSRFRLMKEGHLMVQDVHGRWVKIKEGAFCIDGMTGYLKSGPYLGDVKDQVFLDRSYYEEEGEENFDDLRQGRQEVFYITLMFIGAAFLFAISILYLLIWEKHNIHGWTIFAFVTTMFFMFIFLAVSILFSLSMTDEFGGTGACKTIGVLAHFFYLSTMCWLTVINMDLWLTFRNVKPTKGRSQNFVRFFLYSLFAIGIPMLIIIIALTLDYVYEGAFGNESECEPPVYLPLYGKQQCYMQRNAYWPYLYIPMSILISCNILTFSSTMFTLCLYRNHTRAVASGGHHKESVVLFGKLFIVTGISWVLELISNTFPEPWWLWIIFDAYNLLQAVLIFIIFGLKRENILILYHKYPVARILLLPIMRTPCCYTNSFDPEKTEVTGLPYDYRNSRISFRRGSNLSTSAMVSNNSNGNYRRKSEDL